MINFVYNRNANETLLGYHFHLSNWQKSECLTIFYVGEPVGKQVHLYLASEDSKWHSSYGGNTVFSSKITKAYTF